MKGKKFLVISILGAIVILASSFAFLRNYEAISAKLGQEAQVTHSNDYGSNLENHYQAALAAPSQRLIQMGAILKSERGGKIDFSSKKLINNLWGAPIEEKLTSEVYMKENKTFGWYWDRSTPLTRSGISGYQPIYPNVRTGGCPWEASRTAYFPLKVSDVKTLEFNSEYSYPVSPTGTYNLAYDMFLSDTDQVSADPKPKAEIMIWLHYTLQQPANAHKGDVSDGINNYGFYSFTMPNGRLYYAFIMKEQTALKAQHTVNAKRLMDHLKLDPNWYLHGVELGNEVVNGSGNIEISNNDVNLNGHEL